MKELVVKIRFLRPCLGNARDRRDGSFRLPRTPDGSIMFLQSWQHANLRTAASILGRHQTEVDKILWDVAVAAPHYPDCWYRRYYTNGSGKQRYIQHEALMPGQAVSISCAVPETISDADFLALMNLAGRYRGISPWKPGEFGQFVVESVRPRTAPAEPTPAPETLQDETR